MSGSQEALDRFERRTAWPMMALALAIIPLLVVPHLVDLASGAETTFVAIDWLIWIAFVLEYGPSGSISHRTRNTSSPTTSSISCSS
jgi:hypothetical protein